jgi:hypothetical protein
MKNMSPWNPLAGKIALKKAMILAEKSGFSGHCNDLERLMRE